MQIKQIQSMLFGQCAGHLDAYAEEDAIGPIQRDEALLLLGLVCAIRPKVIVEFGFFEGHSALNFLQALDGRGELYSYDVSDRSEEIAKRCFGEVLNFHFIKKSQQDFSPGDIAGKRIDFAFLDGAHVLSTGQATLRAILPALAEDAIIAVHDTGLWSRSHFLPTHHDFQRGKESDWLDGENFQHQKCERELVNWITTTYPEFQALHFHSRNCLRHGLTLLQRRRLLETETPR